MITRREFLSNHAERGVTLTTTDGIHIAGRFKFGFCEWFFVSGCSIKLLSGTALLIKLNGLKPGQILRSGSDEFFITEQIPE